ncbi:MAG: M24 family metallopeptidase, partial [Dehalococcoidia bacterium]
NAMQAVIDTIRPGVTEVDLRRAYKAAVGEQDAEFEFFNCPAGPRVGLFFPPSGYRLQPGDNGMFDGGCIYNFYHADTGMCYHIGEPDSDFVRMFEAMVKTMAAGLEMLRPGVLPSQVYQVMAEAQVKNHGALAGHFGHGIGLEPRDIPLISSIYAPPPAKAGEPVINEDPPLEPGVVLCIETPFRVFEGKAVHMEYTLVITERGWENIVPVERQLLVL